MRSSAASVAGTAGVPARLFLPVPRAAGDSRGARFLWTASLLLSLAFSHCHAAAPTLDHLYPPSARPGSTNELTAIGTFTPWPATLIFNHPGLHATPTTNSGKYTLLVEATVPPATYLVRALNDEGASNPRFLIVDRLATRLEVEPNDSTAQSQAIESLPAVVEGRLEKKDDVDAFQVTLKKGRTLIARLEAFLLGSPLDAVLRVRDERGSIVVWNHDDGFTLDPFVAMTAPADGKYRVEVFGFPHPGESEVRFAGNAKCVYRLHLEDGPYVGGIDPAGLSRSNVTTARIRGWNLGSNAAAVTLPAFTSAPPDLRWVVVELPALAGPARLPLGNGPELQELPEPAQPRLLPVPGAVTGTLEKPGERDRYPFVATQGVSYRVEVQASALGSPLDAWVRIQDSTGKELAMNEDASMGDPSLIWKAPSDGTNTVVVGSSLAKAGPGYRYRLEVQPLAPAVRAVAGSASVLVEAGKTNELKITLQRIGGLEGPIRIEAGSLPEGVSAEPVEAAAGTNEATLRFVAATNAPASQRGLQLFARPGTNGMPVSILHEMATTGENNGVPQGFHQLLVNQTDWLWLTVRKAPEVIPAPRP